ncbi:MAG: hypothetical protein V2I67_00580, partial [Thermoanaerobaculales bacterium]|nr:hypothetical protein [Thermoanaerobaculales bacterium]
MDRYLLRNWLPPVIGLALVMTLSTMVSAQDLHSGDIGPTFGPVTATCAFEFSLWDATAGGSQIGTVIESELDVRGGLYEAELDFGAEADDTATRFLEVAVGCPAGTAELTTLTRRLFLPASEPADHGRGDGRAVAHGTAAPPKVALGTAFTYQGELQESGTPVTGSGDFQFSLWDAASGGAQIGATVPVNSVAVADGRFTTSLD